MLKWKLTRWITFLTIYSDFIFVFYTLYTHHLHGIPCLYLIIASHLNVAIITDPVFLKEAQVLTLSIQHLVFDET